MNHSNLPAILKLVNAAFDLEGLNNFCFLYFRPVYEQFRETDRKDARVRMLVDYAERQGQLDKLLAHINEENPGKYAEFADELSDEARPQPAAPPAGGSVFNQQGQQVGAQFNVTGDLTISSTQSPGSRQRGTGSGLEPEQEEILRRLYDESLPALVLDPADLEMHLALLEQGGYIKIAQTFERPGIAILTPKGRLLAKKLQGER